MEAMTYAFLLPPFEVVGLKDRKNGYWAFASTVLQAYNIGIFQRLINRLCVFRQAGSSISS